MESSGELLAPSRWSVYGKCAKTHIIVDWGAGWEVGAVIGHAGQPGNGFLHQKYNIIIYGDSQGPSCLPLPPFKSLH